MTPEAFEDAIRHSPSDELVAALDALDEKARKSLRKVVKKVMHDVERRIAPFLGGFAASEWEKRRKAYKKWQDKNPYVEANTILAQLACGSAADAHRLQLWQLRGEGQLLIASVLISRRPRWLDSWVRKRLDGERARISWPLLRALLEAGLVEKPEYDGYTALFVEAMRGYEHGEASSYIPTSERLRNEPELLEDEIWRIFDCENPALTSDWYARGKAAPANYETWSEAFVRLANDGDIDRGRLLDVTLKSMQAEMKQNYLSAFGRLHTALAPSRDEMAERQQAYLDLLVSPVGPVLSFAVRMLSKMHRASVLDIDRFLVAARPVLAHKAKGTAMQVLKIAATLPVDDSSSLRKITDLVIAAMAHPAPDAQEAALDILERCISKADADTREEAERHVPFLAAKLQARARMMFGVDAETRQPAESESGPDSDYSKYKACLLRLPAGLQTVIGFDERVADGMPPALRYRLLELPRIAERSRLEPVAGRDELLELAARLLERVESPEQVEVLLHGIALLGRDRSGSFDKLAKPLIQRLESGHPSHEGLCARWDPVSTALADLMLSWWTGRYYDSSSQSIGGDTPQSAFAVARLREVQAVLFSESDHRLLAFPSFTTGWIDPVEFVRRIAVARADAEIREYDLMQGLLRLGPGDRDQALKEAIAEHGKLGRLLRFALGGDDAPKRSDRRDAHLWYCAARARDPGMSDLSDLGPLTGKVPELPGSTFTADWAWTVKIETHNSYRSTRVCFDDHLSNVEVTSSRERRSLKKLKRSLTQPAWRKWPTLGLRAWPTAPWYALSQYTAIWSIQWLAMRHPTDTETFMSIAVRMLDMRVDDNTSNDSPAHAFFTALFDSTRPWGDMTHLAVCLGLLSRSSDSRGYAIDALVPAIESGHADWRAMASVFRELLDNAAYKINRFGPSMSAVLDVSNLHRWWAGRLIDELVAQFEVVPRGAHFLYETALECFLPLDARPSDAMAAQLKQHKGGSKTAKLAKELLSLEGKSILEPGPSVVAAAWTGRAQFGERVFGPHGQ